MAKVHIQLFMPLFLQLVSKQADVGPTSIRLLRLPTFISMLLSQVLPGGVDVAIVRGNLCRSTCVLMSLIIVQEEMLKHLITAV